VAGNIQTISFREIVKQQLEEENVEKCRRKVSDNIEQVQIKIEGSRIQAVE